MNRFGNILCLILIVIVTLYVYKIKYETMYLLATLRHLRDSIEHTQRDIIVYRAEWSYLTNPGRLSTLSKRYLNLSPPQTEQWINPKTIPFCNPP